MNKTVLIVSISILLVAVVALVLLRNASGSRSLENRPLRVIDSMNAGHYQNVVDLPAPPKVLDQTWASHLAKRGHLEQRYATGTKVESDGVRVVYFICKFERGTLWGVAKFNRMDQMILFSLGDRPNR